MASLSVINSRIGYYEGEIEKNNIQIKKLEREYAELIAFKSKVQSSQQSFAEGNQNKIRALEAVSKYINNNSHANRYYHRTKNGLTKTGDKLLTKGYGYLLEKISKELLRMKNKVRDLENENNRYASKIDGLEDDYAKEKKRLEEEAKNEQ